jgi:hypothetical protein
MLVITMKVIANLEQRSCRYEQYSWNSVPRIDPQIEYPQKYPIMSKPKQPIALIGSRVKKYNLNLRSALLGLRGKLYICDTVFAGVARL